jgi:hypothetical protein
VEVEWNCNSFELVKADARPLFPEPLDRAKTALQGKPLASIFLTEE